VQFQGIYILPPQKGLQYPGGWGGGSVRPNRNFQGVEEVPSVGEVWIFYGTKHYASETMKSLFCTQYRLLYS